MNRIIRHLKDGFLGVFRHFALSFSSISSMTVMLLLMALFMLLNENLVQVTQEIEENVALYIQITDGTEQEDINKLQQDVKNISGILQVRFSSKEDELDYFIASSGEEGESLYGGFRGDENPFLDVLIANVRSGSNVKTLSDDLSTLDNVFKVSYGGDGTQTLIDVMSQVRDIGFVFVIVLSAVAVFLIANTISATIYSRQKEISIMRTVGATNWYIRWPFVIEGMIIGLLGSVVPVLLTIFGYSKFYELQNASLGGMFKLVPAEPLVWEVVGILVLTGAVVGALGSLITVSRRLRWTR